MQMRYVASGLVVALVIGIDAVVGEEFSFADCPAAIQQGLRGEAEDSAIDTVDQHTDDDGVTYGASATIRGKRYRIVVANDGALIEKTLDLVDGPTEAPFSEAPAAVQKTLQEESKGAKIATVNRATVNGQRVYTATAAVNGHKYAIEIEQDGTLLEKRLDELVDEEIELVLAPAAVKKLLDQETRGGKLADLLIEQTELGRTSYTAVITIAGKQYALLVAEDGTLLSKIYEGDADDEKGAEGK